MLRLYDVRTRKAEDIRPAYPGELRVLASTPGSAGPPSLGVLRCWLLPDLITRWAELRGLVSTVCEITMPAGLEGTAGNGAAGRTAGAGSAAAPGPEAAPSPEAARAALNIHPPARTAPAGEPVERTVKFVAPGRAGLTGGRPPFDIGIGIGDSDGLGDSAGEGGQELAGGGLAGPELAGGRLAGPELAAHLAGPPGAVTVNGRKTAAGDATAPGLNDITARGLDPLTVRLVFLARRYRDDLDVSWEGLFSAATTLLRWRESVAQWALSPSAPMVRPYADAVGAAFGNDLDTPAALRELHTLAADNEVPPGAKFETFAAMDRLLGLDLAREIGR